MLHRGLGGLLWVPMTSFWGRAPVLLWTTILGLIFSILAATASDFNTFYAMRALTGLFITAPQTIAIAFLRDMFFFHERARKIGLWAVLYISSPYIGPCLANFVLAGTQTWRNVFWMDVGVVALQIVFILLFIDETFYNRDRPRSAQPDRPSGFGGRMLRLIGVWQIRNISYYNTVVGSYRRFISILLKPAFLLLLIQ